MRQLRVRPVKLSAASSTAIAVGFAITRLWSPESLIMRHHIVQWAELFAVELASAFPLFFIHKKVRGARWLWLVWLVAAASYSVAHFAPIRRSYFTWLVTGIYLAWAVKIVVLAMLFTPSPRDTAENQSEPNKAPEPTPGLVTPRALK